MNFFKEQHLISILKGSHTSEIDSKCFDAGIDSKLLMNNAGTKVSDFISSRFETPDNKNVTFWFDDIELEKYPVNKSKINNIKGAVVCGGGNNGGDGFVCAINLVKKGYFINLYCITAPEKFSKDSSFYFNELEKLKNEGKLQNLNIYFVLKEDADGINNFKDSLKNSSFIVDAIFGTGLHGNEVKGFAREIIGVINDAKDNNSKLAVISVDIPSGIDSDNGKVLGEAVRADYTITFGVKKLGITVFPGAFYAGKVEVADIGIPEKYYEEYEKIYEAGIKWIADKIPERTPASYKHSVGKLLVIAGSLGFTGAAVMTCEAAMRTGAGIVTLVCPWELNPVFEVKLTEVMTFPVEQTEEGSIHFNSFDEILEESEKYDALAIGPGISRNPSTVRLVREILKKIKKPTVLDADGLKTLSSPMDTQDDDLFRLNHVIITPHSGELASILSKEKIEFEKRLEANTEASRKFSVVSLLKGPGTLITNTDNISFINPTGDFALATAGTGDILTGIIGSLLCQGMDLTDAAVCGAYIHGLASDIISRKTGKTSMIATDLLEGIKYVFLEIEKLKY
ncbi:NAD(P)H-hydrate dehydratase [bacterium]|nr:NAD(P)H-hydrate dehydratase [bacterium]